jgi:hypothetical protein
MKDHSKQVQTGKSMGEFGEVDTTRTKGRQGWKVQTKERNTEKKKRNQKNLSSRIYEAIFRRTKNSS